MLIAMRLVRAPNAQLWSAFSLVAALGMWTVTLVLKPVIVSAHLLGGMSTLALLVWLVLRQLDGAPVRTKRASVARPC